MKSNGKAKLFNFPSYLKSIIFVQTHVIPPPNGWQMRDPD